MRRGFLSAVPAAIHAARRGRGENGAAQRAALRCGRYLDRHAADISQYLHEQGVFAADAARGRKALHPDAMLAVIINDHAGAKGGRLQHSAVDVLRPAGGGESQDQAAQIAV